MSFKIESAGYSDLDVLAEIEKECFTSEAYTKTQLAHLLKNSDTMSYVAKKEDEAVGFVIGMKVQYGSSISGHIVTLDVLPKHRRAGVGLALLDRLEQELFAKGVRTIYLEVRIDNQAARSLYAKKGYGELGPLENYYDRGKHGLQMKKTLK